MLEKAIRGVDVDLLVLLDGFQILVAHGGDNLIYVNLGLLSSKWYEILASMTWNLVVPLCLHNQLEVNETESERCVISKS